MAKESLHRVLKAMDKRERKVVELRFGLHGEHPRTLGEISSRFNVSRERIRQIEATALEHIKAAGEIQAMRECGPNELHRACAHTGGVYIPLTIR